LDEVQISKVAAVLAEWNPLGSKADSVPDLDGYRIEAIDIIMALGVFRRFVAPEETQRYSEPSIRPVAETHRLCVACEEDPDYP